MNNPFLLFFLLHQNKLKAPKQTKKSQAQQENTTKQTKKCSAKKTINVLNIMLNLKFLQL